MIGKILLWLIYYLHYACYALPIYDVGFFFPAHFFLQTCLRQNSSLERLFHVYTVQHI